jgi:nucleotide-binding universal stress UspA family protein
MKKILVATDASKRAPLVIEAAVRLAESSKAKLVLYRAVTVPPDVPRELLVSSDRLEDVLLSNARGDLQRVAETLKPELVDQVLVTFATPWDGICQTARELAVDLIVIGSHGYSGIDRVLGTTAAKVVNHADRNVLVVRTQL